MKNVVENRLSTKEQEEKEREETLVKAMDKTIETWIELESNYKRLEEEYYFRLKNDIEDGTQMIIINSTDKKLFLYHKNSTNGIETYSHLFEEDNFKYTEEYVERDEEGEKKKAIRRIQSKDKNEQEIIFEEKKGRNAKWEYYVNIVDSQITEVQLDFYDGKYKKRYYKNADGESFNERVRYIHKVNS